MAKVNGIKIFYKEVYPVSEKKVLGLFKIKEVLFNDKISSSLVIQSNDTESINTIYFNGKKIYEKSKKNNNR